MDRTFRHVQLVGAVAASSSLRTGTFNGAEHIIVPVVAMVEGVVWAVNSDFPELVTAEELAVSPQQWNGRGCFAGHPEDNGTQVTANTPRTLETSFGYVFDASSPSQIMTRKRLEVFAWLDPVKAAKAGPKAEDVIRRLQAGKPVEVSVGCFVVSLQEEGEYNDKPYVGRWTDIVSDHLAFLGENEVGACSIAAGCGAARSAVRHLITAKGIEPLEEPMSKLAAATTPTPTPPKTTPTPPKTTQPSTPSKKGLLQKFDSFLTTLLGESTDEITEEAAEQVGYGSIQTLLDQARASLDAGDEHVAALIAANGTDAADEVETARLESLVAMCFQVYGTMNGIISVASKQLSKGNVDSMYYMKGRSAKGARHSKTDAAIVQTVHDHSVALGASCSGMTDAEKNPKAASSGKCGCGSPLPVSPTTATAETGENKMDIKALISNSKGKFTEADEKWLSAMPEDRVKALFETPESEPEPKVAAAKPKTTEEFLADAPAEVVEIITTFKANEAAKKVTLVGELKAAQTAYTEDELKAMGTKELTKLHQALGLDQPPTPNYAGRGVPRAAAQTQEEKDKDVYANPPNGYEIALERMRGAGAATKN